MALLVLNWVQCKDQQESGSDEIYFVFKDNGTGRTDRTNTIGSMDEENGGDRFNLTDRFSFTDSVDVQLWEEDPGPDDYIDSAIFRDTAFGDHGTEVLSAKRVTCLLNYAALFD